MIRIPVEYVMSNSVHKVRFTETDASPYEKRIIGFSGSLGYGKAGCMGKAVLLPHDK